MIKKIIVACCDEEVREIVLNGLENNKGNQQVLVCKTDAELYEMIKYEPNVAIIFDKFFLGYVITYQLLRLKAINSSINTYFVEKGEGSLYFGLRVYELGTGGFIPDIENKEVFKQFASKISAGLKQYPDEILDTISDGDYIFDKKCFTEVTAKEMEIGMYMGMGKSQKEISFLTGMSPKAVSLHTYRLKRKIGYKMPTDYEKLNRQCFKNMIKG